MCRNLWLISFHIFFLNRGGCQAIEDAYVLTENLANTKSTAKIEDSLQDFYRKRILRVSAVQLLSRLASDLIVNAFDTPWSPHDNLGKSWKSYLTFFWKVSTADSIIHGRNYCAQLKFHMLDSNSPKNSYRKQNTINSQPILQYAIFPAQFAFLYSYYPTGR